MEKNLINEKIELIIIIIPNNNDKLIDLIINDFKSENEETRKSFEDALIRMCNILISKDKFDILFQSYLKKFIYLFL